MPSPSLDLHTLPTSPAYPIPLSSSLFPTRPLSTTLKMRGRWQIKDKNSSSSPLLLGARNQRPTALITLSPTSPTPLLAISWYHSKSRISPRRNGLSIAMHRLTTEPTLVYPLLHVPASLIHSSIVELDITTSIKTLPPI